MKQRDDIDIDRTWLWSDTHFGHRNIIGFTHRPDDFEQILMENVAQEVPDDEDVTLLHLGDLSYRNNAMFRAVISKHISPLNGRKLLIRGNHDHSRPSFYSRSGFRIVSPFWIPYDSWRISFSHYPWNSDKYGPMPPNELRIHGHIHNNGYSRSVFTPFLRNHVNISVEQTKLKPVNLGVLLRAVLDGTYANDPGDAVESINADAVEKATPHVA